MIIITQSLPQLSAIPSYRPILANIRSSLENLAQILRAEQEQETLRALDQRIREDIGLASPGPSAGGILEGSQGLLREVFSWTRFSK